MSETKKWGFDTLQVHTQSVDTATGSSCSDLPNNFIFFTVQIMLLICSPFANQEIYTGMDLLMYLNNEECLEGGVGAGNSQARGDNYAIMNITGAGTGCLCAQCGFIICFRQPSKLASILYL